MSNLSRIDHPTNDQIMARSRAYRNQLRWFGRVQGFFVGLLAGAVLIVIVLAFV